MSRNRNKPDHPWYHIPTKRAPDVEHVEVERPRERNYSDRLGDGFTLLDDRDPEDHEPDLD